MHSRSGSFPQWQASPPACTRSLAAQQGRTGRQPRAPCDAQNPAAPSARLRCTSSATPTASSRPSRTQVTTTAASTPADSVTGEPGPPAPAPAPPASTR